jgi:hypothetical protein
MWVFITAGPSTKLFAWGGGDMGGHVIRETTSRVLCGLGCPSRTAIQTITIQCVCVYYYGPSTKLFAWGGEGIWEDMCYERRRAEACVDGTREEPGWDP